RDGRLPGSESDQLHDVVGHHIAQGAGGIVMSAASFDADSLAHGDLNVIDVVAIPDRLKQAVSEAEDQNILYRLFAEIVIDAVHLVFVEDLFDSGVQRPGRFQVMSEGLFDDHATPRAVSRLRRKS